MAKEKEVETGVVNDVVGSPDVVRRDSAADEDTVDDVATVSVGNAPVVDAILDMVVVSTMVSGGVVGDAVLATRVVKSGVRVAPGVGS